MRRVQEILEYLVRLLVDQKQVDEQTLVRELLDEGYDFDEIEAAFSSLMDLFGDDAGWEDAGAFSDEPLADANSCRAPRILTDEETQGFAPDAYGTLVRLQSKGLLTAEEVDRIVGACQRANVDLIEGDELNFIIAHVSDVGGLVFDLDGPHKWRFLH